MSVHTQRDSLRVVTLIFEARYDEGYRFLDHRGELVARIRRHNPSWIEASLTVKTATFICQEKNLLLNIGVDKIDVSTTSKQLSLSEAEKQSRILGEEAEWLYALTVELLKIPRTTRVGIRVGFLAPSDNLEEADRFMWRAASSPLLNAVKEQTKSEAYEAQVVCVVDDSKTGHRRRITLGSFVTDRKPEDPPYLGLPGEIGTGGVIVDIDTLMRPEQARLDKVSLIVQDNYLLSQSHAIGLFGWLLGQQK